MTLYYISKVSNISSNTKILLLKANPESNHTIAVCDGIYALGWLDQNQLTTIKEIAVEPSGNVVYISLIGNHNDSTDDEDEKDSNTLKSIANVEFKYGDEPIKLFRIIKDDMIIIYIHDLKAFNTAFLETMKYQKIKIYEQFVEICIG